jgi:hypothetical protein
MRSVWQFIPSLGQIYLVTAGEWPGWLDPGSPRIKHVRHEEIFPNTACLPTFNSCAIEACLHAINGLSEEFLYFNDDILILNPLDPFFFVDSAGRQRLRFAPWQIPTNPNDSSPVGAAGAYCRGLLDQHFGPRRSRPDTLHEAFLFRRSLLAEMEAIWPAEFAQTRHNRFRTGRDLQLCRIYAHYLFETGRHVQRHGASSRMLRFNGSAPHTQAFLQGQETSDAPFLCINDEVGEGRPVPPDEEAYSLGLLAEFLERRFPQPAPWESAVNAPFG